LTPGTLEDDIVGRLNLDLTTVVPGKLEPGPRRLRNQTLKGRIALDNTVFEDCRFLGAVLVYSGGVPPTLRDCLFDSVTFEFDGAAGRTLGLLQAMSASSSGLRDLFRASFPKMFGH